MPKNALIPGKAVFKVKKAYIQWRSQHKMLPKKNLSEDITKLLSSKRAEKRLLGTLEMAILPNSDCATRLFLTLTYSNL